MIIYISATISPELIKGTLRYLLMNLLSCAYKGYLYYGIEKDSIGAGEYSQSEGLSAPADRARTRFPTEVQGVLKDCNKAIALEPQNKNAYFLRGLALYELGGKKQACNDFPRAIELGITDTPLK